MSDVIAPIMSRYASFAMTADGIPEVNSLTYVGFESNFSDPLPNQRLALVLVEPRLLTPGGNPTARSALMRCLQRLKGDLRAEGLVTRFISADVYGGPVHKDGRTLLAVRQFFADVKAVFPKFEGAILVGNFPEATLVRTVAWSPSTPAQLVIGAELISERADIVLADLTGHWDQLYRQADFTVEGISARPDQATMTRGWNDGERVRDATFTSSDYTVSSGTFRDAFHLDDAIVDVVQRTPALLEVQLHRGERNNEVDSQDRTMTNIIARPDISVSRINALHVAVNPNPALVGTDGHHFLDAGGNPQTVASTTPLFTGDQHLQLFNFRDFDLERRLLVEYFDRNHRFRTGGYSNLPFRVATICGAATWDPHFYADRMTPAVSDFSPAVEVPDATLPEYVNFLKTPAVFKYVMAHSNSIVSEFRDAGDVPALTSAVGGAPVRWTYDHVRYTPGFDGQGGLADLFVHRAMWQNHAFQNAGASLVVHGGCNVNSIPETETRTYTSPDYGRWNNAEGFLFFTNCVALFSRAKGFNDDPWGFAEGYRLSDRANFGSCWSSYYNNQSSDAFLTSYNIQRKRAYFWSINGDWSLRLRNRNGLGLVGLPGSLKSIAVHPNRAWIDGWNFDAGVNQVRGIGDMDGDTIDEFVITSEWGIGIVKHNGVSFRTLMLASRDTWFGGWRWDATVNRGRDRIQAVADFTGDGKTEIMVWSSWGVATLGYATGALAPTRIHVNGTRLGGWLLDTAGNTYAGQGRLATGTTQVMVLTSPWGVGLISMQHNNAVFLAPNGTRLGDWMLNTANNRIQLIADLDGDGFDEIVVTSPWGLGVLKMIGGNLRSVAMHANGDDLGGYIARDTDTFALSGRIRGGSANEIVVRSPAGIHVLALAGPRLTRVAFAPHGTRLDGWVVDAGSNWLQAAGDLSGDGRADFIIRSPWGIGILGMDAAARLHCHALVPYGAMLGDWHLETGDVISGAARFAGGGATKALVLTKP